MQQSQSELLVEIEGKTEEWIRCRYQPEKFYEELSSLMFDFSEIYQSGNCYFGYISAWNDLIDMEKLYELNFFDLSQYLEKQTFKYYKDYFSSYTEKHKRDLRRHRANEIRNMKSLRLSVENAIYKYSKSLVVRVDLGYLKDIENKININVFYDDFHNFIKRAISDNRISTDLVNYHWALEQGETKGYHCHLLMIFNGHKRRSGWYIADIVGRLWKEVTQNDGCYFNCHDQTQIQRYIELDRLGIGMIHRNDIEEVDRMLNAVSYLVSPEKEEQHLRVKIGPKMRTFQ